VSDEAFQRSDSLLERAPAVETESPDRDWAGIGVGLVGAFALSAVLLAATWALVVLVEASV
jgi:hypothetical protein